MISPLRRKHRTTAKLWQIVNPPGARHARRAALVALTCGMLALGSIANAADNSSHLKWRKPVKDDPFQGIASANRTAKSKEKVKWQPYRPYKSNPVRRVSTNPATARKIEKKASSRPAKIAVSKDARKLEGPKMQLVQFDDPFAPPKKEDVGPPKDDPKADDKKDGEPTPADPFAPPPRDGDKQPGDDKKPGKLPSPTDFDDKDDDKDMTPPDFGDPPKDDDKKDEEPVDPFGPPKDDTKDDPKQDPFEDDPVQPPKDTDPKDMEPKDTDPKDPEPMDMEPGHMPPLLEPGDGEAKPIKATTGYAEVLKVVEERLAPGSLQRINIDIAVTGQPDQDRPMVHRWEEDDYEPRSWALTTFTWKASALCHKPLYFEQVHVERYGHARHPLLEPVLEGAHFFASVPLLPYKMGLQPPKECVYALGYYRPGSCAPYLLDPLPLSLRGALFQGAAIYGGVALLP